MLELDLLLGPFVQYCYETLTREQQLLYQEFLTHEDQELYAWLLSTQKPQNKAFNVLIRQILENPKRSS